MGKELRWYNADDVIHKIIVSNDNETGAAGGGENKKIIIDSGDIKPKVFIHGCMVPFLFQMIFLQQR